MKRIVAILVLLLFFVSGCTKVIYVEITPAPTNTPAVTPTSTPTTAPTATPTPQTTPTDKPDAEDEDGFDFPPETVLSFLRTGFKDSDGVKYEVEYSPNGDVFIIYVTVDGMAQIAQSAIDGNSKSADDWNKQMQVLTDLSDATIKYIRVLGSQSSMSFILRNDINPDNSLASMLNSVVIFDVTE